MYIAYLLLILFFCYAALSIYEKVSARKKIKYWKYRSVDYVLDTLLIPFMNVVATGKDTHWWDWDEVPKSQIDPRVKKLVLESEEPQQRVYKKTKLFGPYNWEGIKDLYKTLVTLQTVAVLEPKHYKGYWSLVEAGCSFHDKRQYDRYERVNVLVKGKVRVLLDGKKIFVGITEDGKYIPLRLIKITSRRKFRSTAFV